MAQSQAAKKNGRGNQNCKPYGKPLVAEIVHAGLDAPAIRKVAENPGGTTCLYCRVRKNQSASSEMSCISLPAENSLGVNQNYEYDAPGGASRAISFLTLPAPGQPVGPPAPPVPAAGSLWL